MQINVVPHTLRFKQPAGTSRGVYHERQVWYLCVAEPQLWGVGECAPLPGLSSDDVPDYEVRLRAFCAQAEALPLGADGFDVRSLVEAIPALRDYPSMLFGLETLALSLAAYRRSGHPFLLYDTPFSRGAAGTIINGLVWMGTYEQMLQRMEEKLSAGFRCVKIKIGAIDFEREEALLRRLRERYPAEQVELRVDANGGFTPEQALGRLRTLAQYDIHSIEQPIRAGQWHAMARLCRETPLPIALDEELIGVNDVARKAELLDTIRPQYIILKPSLHGGLAGCHEWIGLARERGIGTWMTSALESNVGLNAIAQWQTHLADLLAPMPQGLGTGALFVENYPHVALSVVGDKLFMGEACERDFWRELAAFLAEWRSPASTVQVFTSGSTGAPKPMAVEKARMVASARMTLRVLGLERGSTALLCMPLRYIAGKMMVVRALVGGLRLLSVSPSSRPLRQPWLRPDFLAVTPMQAYETLRHGTADEQQRFRRVPVIIVGGGAVSEALLRLLQSCSGRVYSTYGMTETLSHIALRRLNPDAGAYTPLEGVTVTTDADGCLVIDAPAVAASPLHTHDIAEILADGTFRILGRKDNVICTGGIKVQIERVEQALRPLIDETISYAVAPLPDERLGQMVTLVATAPLDLDALTADLSPYERPRRLVVVESIPRTATGKIARAALHEILRRKA